MGIWYHKNCYLKGHKVILMLSAKSFFVIDKSNHTIDTLCFPCALYILYVLLASGKV